MKVSPTNNPQIIRDPISEKAASAKSGGVSPKNLKNLITSRSKDFLMRMFKHGTSQQKQLAGATIHALDNETLIANPATQLPVRQFGMASKLDGQKGVLMANFRDEGENLDLAAIGFLAAQDLNHNNGAVVTLVLEDAKNLNLGDRLPHGNSGAGASLSKAKVENSGADFSPIRPAPTPIQPTLAKIAEAQDQGISKFSAGPLAHIELREAEIGYKREVIGRNSPEVQQVSIITLGKRAPKVLAHEFSKESFYHFHKEHLGTSKALNEKIDRKGPDRHAGGVMGQKLIDKLNKKISIDSLTEAASPKLEARRDAYNKLTGATVNKASASNIGIKRSARESISEISKDCIGAIESLDRAIEAFLEKSPEVKEGPL